MLHAVTIVPAVRTETGDGFHMFRIQECLIGVAIRFLLGLRTSRYEWCSPFCEKSEGGASGRKNFWMALRAAKGADISAASEKEIPIHEKMVPEQVNRLPGIRNFW